MESLIYKLIIGALAIVLILLLVDNFELIALFENINRVKEVILSFGIWGGIIFALTFSILRPLGFPNALLALVAVSVWSLVPALFFSWLGQLGAQLANFLISRYVAHDFIRNRLSPNWQQYDSAIGRNSFRVILIAQLVFSRSRTVGWFFGLAQVKARTFLFASSIGIIPWVFIYLYFIDIFVELYREGITLEQFIIIGVVVIAVAGVIYRWRKLFKTMLGIKTVHRSS